MFSIDRAGKPAPLPGSIEAVEALFKAPIQGFWGGVGLGVSMGGVFGGPVGALSLGMTCGFTGAVLETGRVLHQIQIWDKYRRR